MMTLVQSSCQKKVLHKQDMKSFAYRGLQSGLGSHVSLLAFFFFAGLGAWFSSGFSVQTHKNGVGDESHNSSHVIRMILSIFKLSQMLNRPTQVRKIISISVHCWEQTVRTSVLIHSKKESNTMANRVMLRKKQKEKKKRPDSGTTRPGNVHEKSTNCCF